jgi:ATP-dependent RNA helicase A
MSSDIKQFLYTWCGKQHKIPNYEFSQQNTKGRIRFKCEVTVSGINYIGIGNSTNKKDAQTNCALDFCQYLVRQGIMNENDLPKVSLEGNTSNQQSLPSGLIAPHQSMGLNFNGSNTDNQMLPYKRGPPNAYLAHLYENQNRKMLEDVDNADTNADIHGGWTIENAKSRLHQFFQREKLKCDYKYESTGPDNNRYCDQLLLLNFLS